MRSLVVFRIRSILGLAVMVMCDGLLFGGLWGVLWDDLKKVVAGITFELRLRV